MEVCFFLPQEMVRQMRRGNCKMSGDLNEAQVRAQGHFGFDNNRLVALSWRRSGRHRRGGVRA